YQFPPKLDFERIEAIAKVTGLPLVLHGGSGLADDDFRTAVEKGVCKINIFTDVDKAGKLGAEKGLQDGVKSLLGLIPYEIEAMKQVVKTKLELFGSCGKA
ncbi:MAG: class II fructose-bisphosphate aldolase, partial [Oscillospiraceae bacterium]|nr:class II fructose-bisphosphate aldolase [Oscillospiraceae bacterium]